MGGASVTFEPGARTAWHTHLLGQTLIITAGNGRVQRWGGAVEEVKPGDVVQFAPSWTFEFPGGASWAGIDISPDGQYLIISDTGPDEIYVFTRGN